MKSALIGLGLVAVSIIGIVFLQSRPAVDVRRAGIGDPRPGAPEPAS